MALIYFFRNFPTLIQQSDGAIRIHFNIPIHTQVFHLSLIHISIGPIPMMKAVSNLTKPYGIKTIISMNTIMVDGTGMCGGCRLTVGGETKFACVDGPDFDGHLVDFDEAMKRLGTYKPEEAREREEHCRLYGGIK